MSSVIVDTLKFVVGILHFGFNVRSRRKPGRRTVVFQNRYRCNNPFEARAWLVVDKWHKTYIYPFESMDHCRCESRSLLYNHAIFDESRYLVHVGGYGFRIQLCKEVGMDWLERNCLLTLPQQSVVIEYISRRPKMSLVFHNF